MITAQVFFPPGPLCLCFFPTDLLVLRPFSRSMRGYVWMRILLNICSPSPPPSSSSLQCATDDGAPRLCSCRDSFRHILMLYASWDMAALRSLRLIWWSGGFGSFFPPSNLPHIFFFRLLPQSSSSDFFLFQTLFVTSSSVSHCSSLLYYAVVHLLRLII